MSTKEILVVDDEIGIRELLSEILFDEGYHVHLAENAAQARAFRLGHSPDLVLLDIWMPDMDGLSLLKEWSSQQLLTMPVVMMSGHGTIETALEAIRVGAIDFLEKPIALQKLLKTVMTTMQHGVPPQAQVQALNEDNPQKNMMGDGMVMVPLPLDLPLREARDYFDNAYFNYQIQKESGNISRVAENIGIERTHLYRKLKQLGIKPGKKTIDTSQ
jgi:DNA-binding NtrC family response regulator